MSNLNDLYDKMLAAIRERKRCVRRLGRLSSWLPFQL